MIPATRTWAPWELEQTLPAYVQYNCGRTFRTRDRSSESRCSDIRLSASLVWRLPLSVQRGDSRPAPSTTEKDSAAEIRLWPQHLQGHGLCSCEKIKELPRQTQTPASSWRLTANPPPTGSRQLWPPAPRARRLLPSLLAFLPPAPTRRCTFAPPQVVVRLRPSIILDTIPSPCRRHARGPRRRTP